MSHFIRKCGVCGTVISQCRCFDCNKTVILDICDNCSKKKTSLKYDSTQDTADHKQNVYDLLVMVAEELATRAVRHDLSKLQPVEKPIFDKFTPLLKGSTYGSDEYKGFLKEMKFALDHHYSVNRHHPEYFGDDGIQGMNLVDIIEMFCDWKAATMRHDDGNLMKSIDINQKRFGYSDELAAIFRNTVEVLNG